MHMHLTSDPFSITPVNLDMLQKRADGELGSFPSGSVEFPAGINPDGVMMRHLDCHTFINPNTVDSLQAQVSRFCTETASLFPHPVELQLLENNDSTSYFYTGPDAAQVSAYQDICHATRALQAFHASGSSLVNHNSLIGQAFNELNHALNTMSLELNEALNAKKQTPSRRNTLRLVTPSDLATIAVYVLVRDSNGAPEMLVTDVTLSQLELDNGEHYDRAEALASERGFDVISVFDESDPAARAVSRSACIQMAEPRENDSSAPAPSA